MLKLVLTSMGRTLNWIGQSQLPSFRGGMTNPPRTATQSSHFVNEQTCTM